MVGRRVVSVVALGVLLAACTSTTPTTDRSHADGPSPVSSPPSAVSLTQREVAVPGLSAADDHLRASCSSRSFCVLISTDGASWVRRGARWDGPRRFAAPPDTPVDGHLSCTGPRFCMASLGSDTFTFDGTRWSRTSPGTWALGVGQLGCAGPSACFAGPTPPNSTGIRSWDGHRWSSADVVDLDGLPLALSCARDGDTCAAVGKSVDLHVGGKWLAPYSPAGPAVAVSCTSATFCLSAENDHYSTWDGSTWAAHRMPAAHTVGAVSCATATFCVGAGQDEFELWDGRTWTSGDAIDGGTTYPFQTSGATLSCPQPRWCLAVGATRTFTYSP